jgi:hypothetical protein
MTSLAQDDETGVIITGAGGVGKTRLSMELALFARTQGWLVLQASPRLQREDLEHLAEAYSSSQDQRILLLFDYLEQARHFPELVDQIISLNVSYGYRIRFAATCRSAYYHSAVDRSLPHHRHMDLTPPAGAAAREWIDSHRAAAVDHILKHVGLSADEAHRAVCHGTPVLAVFLAYLKELHRKEDLAQLLRERNFGVWVSRRLQMTFETPGVSRTLGKLVPMFPMAAHVFQRLTDTERQLFDRLAADRWIERSVPAGSTWIAVHDVLTDQILLAYCQTIPATVPEFIEELLTRAAELGTLRSVLFALQRVSDHPLLADVNWSALLLKKTTQDTAAWKTVSDTLLATSLLEPAELVELLAQRGDLWEGAETASYFHSGLGWLATRLRPQHGEIPEPARSCLANWIKRVAPHADATNYPLTWGLRLCPADVREQCLSWLRRHSDNYDAHYLLVEWLKSGFGWEIVSPFVRQWAQLFFQHPNFSFIAEAWLVARGPLNVLSELILAWVAEHGQKESAQFVYRPWLDAGGELSARVDARNTIADRILNWVAEYGQKEQAEYVYRSWLNAGGELLARVDAENTIADRILKWVAEHGQKEQAEYVYRSWLDAGGGLSARVDMDNTIADSILKWVGEHGQKEVARFVYQSWLDAKAGLSARVDADNSMAGRILKWVAEHGQKEVAQFVYQSWLDSKAGLSARVDADNSMAGRILKWVAEHGQKEVAQFVYQSWLDAGGGLSARVDMDNTIADRILKWVGEHGQKEVAQFVYQSWLDAGGGFIARIDANNTIGDLILAWVTEHGEKKSADFVYRAWLSAGGDLERIFHAAATWLHTNRDQEDAVYLIKNLSGASDLPLQTSQDILYWCRTFPDNPDAVWRLSRLGLKLREPALEDEALGTAEALIVPRLKQDRLDRGTSGQITAIICNLICALAQPLQRQRANALLVAWLRHPSSFGSDPPAFRGIQQPEFVQRVTDLVDAGILDRNKDEAALRRFVAWLKTWPKERLDALRSYCPGA